ncbi:MAG: SDR family NAD(P)-dependent oxidoreductase [Verrucomicrobia bacterium]|nr:SDR family NAD(P)-dependent oxidoreductase [Verrucomicrobiota bacterium]
MKGTKSKSSKFSLGSKSPQEYLKRVALVVVTGGSSGIGSALIKAILVISPGVMVCNLSRKKPEFFSGESTAHYGVDLMETASLALAADWVQAKIAEVGPGEVLLVNNSGFGDYGPFAEVEREKQLDMIDLNVRAVVDLTARLLPQLLERGGAVVNVASTAAFQATPQMATYGASKAFVLSWSLALNEELRGTGVHALAVCPGPTRSNFFKAAGFASPPGEGGLNKWLDMTAEEVATRTLRALARRKAVVVMGWKNALIASSYRFTGKVLCARIAGAAMKKLRLEQYREQTKELDV